MAGYYRKFVEGFSKIVAPLTRLTRKEEPFLWSEACQQSFDELKKRLASVLVLTLPSGQDGFAVYCDDSRQGLGCVLMQNDKVIAYSSSVGTRDASHWTKDPRSWVRISGEAKGTQWE